MENIKQKTATNKLKDGIEESGKRAKGLFSEFKEFITRGSVVDLTIGVVLGAALSRVVTSLVGDILMPVVSLIFGGLETKDLSITIGGAKINYGNFLVNVTDFLIVAACIFFFIKLWQHMRDKFVDEDEKSSHKDKKEELLKEIRDALVRQADD